MTRLINADALIKKWENVHSKDISFEMAIIGATNDVKKAPTIDAVPVRHGKWINCGTYDQGYQVTLECECCGEAVNGYVQDYKYCPYCGAKMEAYEEEEYEEEEE